MITTYIRGQTQNILPFMIPWQEWTTKFTSSKASSTPKCKSMRQNSSWYNTKETDKRWKRRWTSNSACNTNRGWSRGELTRTHWPSCRSNSHRASLSARWSSRSGRNRKRGKPSCWRRRMRRSSLWCPSGRIAQLQGASSTSTACLLLYLTWAMLNLQRRSEGATC